MNKYPGLFQRGDVYWFRKRVPTDIFETYGAVAGKKPKTEEVFSLGTRDRKEAIRKWTKASCGVEDGFDAHRAAQRTHSNDQTSTITDLAPSPLLTDCAPSETRLRPATIRTWSAEYYRNIIDTDFQWRSSLWKSVQADEDAFWREETIEHPYDAWYRKLMEEPVLEHVFLYCVRDHHRNRLASLILARSLAYSAEVDAVIDTRLAAESIAISQLDRNRLVRGMIDAGVKALEDILSHSPCDAHDDEVDSQSISAKVSNQLPAPRCSERVAAYLSEGERGEWPKKTQFAKNQYLNEFMEICGDKPITSYAVEDGEKFKAALMNVPASRKSIEFRGLGLVAAGALADQLTKQGETIKRLSPATINDKLSCVATFFRCANVEKKGGINPAVDLCIRVDKRKKSKRGRPFTDAELNALFRGGVYTGCKSERNWRQPGPMILTDSAKFWIPLLGLYTGARMGELVMLRTADVKTVDDITFLNITMLDEEDYGEDDGVKSHKTSTSERSIPLHHALFDMGFGELLGRRRSEGATRLFPDYHQSEDDDSWSKYFSKFFGFYRKSVGVERSGAMFKCFRHNMEDALRAAGTMKDVRDAIQGHGENGVSQEYGTGHYIEQLNTAIQKVSYPNLDLSHLMTPQSATSPTAV